MKSRRLVANPLAFWMRGRGEGGERGGREGRESRKRKMGRMGGRKSGMRKTRKGIGRREFMKPSEHLLNRQGHLSMAKKRIISRRLICN